MAYTVIGNMVAGDPVPTDWVSIYNAAKAEFETIGHPTNNYIIIIQSSATSGTYYMQVVIFHFQDVCGVNFTTNSTQFNTHNNTNPDTNTSCYSIYYRGGSRTGSGGRVDMFSKGAMITMSSNPAGVYIADATLPYSIDSIPIEQNKNIKKGVITSKDICLGTQSAEIYLGDTKVWG